jgi:uncharacterized membrane protein SpoIIM required for sporulation
VDLDGFLRQGEPQWRRLEAAIERRGALPPPPASPAEIRELVALYRRATADLLWARRHAPNLELLDYLNALVGRGYATIYAPAGDERRQAGRKISAFYRRGFPAALARHRRAIGLAAFLFLLGAAGGFAVARFDPPARFALIPADHQFQTPSERVRQDESSSPRRSPTADTAAAFSAFLFTHNIQVSFLAFSLGLTFGVGTGLALFVNGAMLGALAADYGASGEALFFWAWILPHGVLEILSICIAGGAGFLLARATLAPGPEGTLAALRRAGEESLPLLAGAASLLVVAGTIEGSISQIHGVLLPAEVKLCFAGVVALLLLAYALLTRPAGS